jgi:hypothetical protein
MVFTLCTVSDAINKAGANANISISGGATISDTYNNWSSEAEAVVSDTARVDLVTNFGSLTSEGKQILKNITSALIAQQIINYEPSAIGVAEATLRLNVLENQIRRGLKLIDGDKVKTYLGAT